MADEQNLDPQAFEANAAEAAGDDLVARVHALEEQLAAAQDQALRVLPVVDSLERGIELTSADDEAIKPVREGMELTLKLLQDTFRRFNIEALDPHGAPFNAEHHQAMALQESPHVEPNSVLKVFQKGYLLSGRLLRPAMVVVSKAPAEAPPSIDEQA